MFSLMQLFDKHKKIKEKVIDVILDDGNEGTIEGWIVEQHQEDQNSDVGVVPTTQPSKVRELYDMIFNPRKKMN